MKIKTFTRLLPVLAAAAAMSVSSCSTKRSPLPYFMDINTSAAELVSSQATDYQPRIEPDDELYIMVTSLAPGATAAYNLPLTNPAKTDILGTATTPQIQTYLVDSKGDIVMPVLGKIHVQGMTCSELRDKLIAEIGKDVQDPEVLVRLLNFKVNVAGEVKAPGPQRVNTERYSVLDALTAAGDLTEFGERNNVLLIRENNGKREAHRLDLNSADLLTSPHFYMQQNDYLYVSPNKIRQDNSKYNQNNAFKVSVISTIVSGVSVIASLVIALTVK